MHATDYTNSDLKREKSKCNSTPHVKFIGDEVCMAGLLLTTSCRPRAWPPNGLALGLGLGLDLGSAWSGPTCKVEIDHTHVILCRLAHVSREPPYVITYHGISLMNFMCKSKNLVRTCEHTAVPATRWSEQCDGLYKAIPKNDVKTGDIGSSLDY